MKKPIIIGISGVAQSGKDTFFAISQMYLKNHGLTCTRYALADYLKDECRDFLKEKFDLNVYSQDKREKDIFRPFLVWFGDVKRSQTKGKYFTDILYEKITQDNVSDYAFITDVRYAEYPEDELFWIKNIGGTLVHVKRISEYGYEIPPANENEKRNDPLLEKNSDFSIQWQTNPSINSLYLECIPLMNKLYKI